MSLEQNSHSSRSFRLFFLQVHSQTCNIFHVIAQSGFLQGIFGFDQQLISQGDFELISFQSQF